MSNRGAALAGKGHAADSPSGSGPGPSLRILLVDDDSSSSRAISRDFGRNGVLVTVAPTLFLARTILCEHDLDTRIDVVISEVRLPDGPGESLLPDIEGRHRQPAIIFVSAFLSELDTRTLEYRPVLVPKPVRTPALLRVVRSVATGYSQAMINRFALRFALNKREAVILTLLSQGHGAKEIALQLACSEKTVYFHFARINQKLGCRNYLEILGRLFAFTCQAMGHTPPEYPAFSGNVAFADHRFRSSRKSAAGILVAGRQPHSR